MFMMNMMKGAELRVVLGCKDGGLLGCMVAREGPKGERRE